MFWFDKAKRWIVAHKNWLVLMGLFVLSYALGKKANKNYLEMAKLAKNQYKKDNEELQKLHKQKEKRDKTIEENTKVITKSLKEERDKKIKELEKDLATPDDVFQNIGITKK